MLGRLTRIVVQTVLAFYAARAAQEGGLGAKSGAVSKVHGEEDEGGGRGRGADEVA